MILFFEMSKSILIIQEGKQCAFQSLALYDTKQSSCHSNILVNLVFLQYIFFYSCSSWEAYGVCVFVCIWPCISHSTDSSYIASPRILAAAASQYIRDAHKTIKRKRVSIFPFSPLLSRRSVNKISNRAWQPTSQCVEQRWWLTVCPCWYSI